MRSNARFAASAWRNALFPRAPCARHFVARAVRACVRHFAAFVLQSVGLTVLAKHDSAFVK
eukprot:7174255-Lingulodinium_polyedra.AAC.1